jgi:hypothetical protein
MNDTDHTEMVHAVVKEITSRMRKYLSYTELCLSQIDYQQAWYRAHLRANSIGNLVLHVAGNLQQIANGLRGKPDTRDRPSEFSTQGGISVAELGTIIHNAVTECCDTLDSLSLNRITGTYRTQTGEVKVAYGLAMAVSHFGLHLGQMQFITKMLLQERYHESWTPPVR